MGAVNNSFDDKEGWLERVSEGGKTGYRIRDKVVANYGNTGIEAVDLGHSTAASSTKGATGDYSTV